MLRANSRFIQQYDLALRPSPKTPATAAAKFHLEDLYRLLKLRIDAKQTVYKIKRETAAYRIIAAQLNTAGGYITFLIQHGDKNAADGGIVNLDTGVMRHVRKGEGEGMGACGHFVVMTTETATGSQTFPAALETIPGISRSVVERLLNSELKRACEGQLFYRGGKGEDKPLRPIGELLGRPSDTLVQAIKGGKLENISLVSREVVSDLDEAQYIREAEKTLRYAVGSDALGDRAMDVVRGLFNKAKEDDVRAMRVRFREGGRSQTVELDLEADSIENTLFNKVSQVNLDVPLDALTEVIRYDLVTEMVALLR